MRQMMGNCFFTYLEKEERCPVCNMRRGIMFFDDVRNKVTTAFKDRGKNTQEKKTKQSKKIADGGIFYCWRPTPFSLN